MVSIKNYLIPPSFPHGSDPRLKQPPSSLELVHFFFIIGKYIWTWYYLEHHPRKKCSPLLNNICKKLKSPRGCSFNCDGTKISEYIKDMKKRKSHGHYFVILYLCRSHYFSPLWSYVSFCSTNACEHQHPSLQSMIIKYVYRSEISGVF
jgi:hypothetical protein